MTLERDFCDFVKRAQQRYPLRDIYCDSAEQILIRGLEAAARREHLPVMIHNARKSPINDRISFYLSLMGQKRYFIHRRCPVTLKAFERKYQHRLPRCTGIFHRKTDEGYTGICPLINMKMERRSYGSRI